MKLRRVEFVDFRQSEANIFKMWRAKRQNKDLRLAVDDVVLFISRGLDQLVFVSRPFTVGTGLARGFTEREIIASRRLRVPGGMWNVLMLGNYAKMVGLTLDGIELLEEWFARKQAEKTERKKQPRVEVGGRKGPARASAPSRTVKAAA